MTTEIINPEELPSGELETSTRSGGVLKYLTSFPRSFSMALELRSRLHGLPAEEQAEAARKFFQE